MRRALRSAKALRDAPANASLIIYNVDMCLICVEIAKSKMTTSEARQALREMRLGLDKAHVVEVEMKIDEAEKAASSKP